MEVVRYRGMVQDMLDPEFFLGVYQQTHIKTKEKHFYQENIKTYLTHHSTWN